MRRIWIHFHLMASGLSRRFGSNKLLYEWEGRPLYQRALFLYEEVGKQLQAAQASCAVPIEVEPILYCIAADPEILNWASRETSAIVVQNLENYEGISASIRKGIVAAQEWEQKQISSLPAHQRSQWEAYDVFCVCDQPRLQAKTLVDYFRYCIEHQIPLATPAADAIWGNPCWFSSLYREELLALSREQGGKTVIRNHMEELTLYPVDLSELLDIDTQEDLSSVL